MLYLMFFLILLSTARKVSVFGVFIQKARKTDAFQAVKLKKETLLSDDFLVQQTTANYT